MASITRGLITHSTSETVVRNKVYVLSFQPLVGVFGVFAFGGGIVAAHHHAAGGGFIAVPLVLGLLSYLLWVMGRHQSIRLRPTGLVVENALIRHEYSWAAGPTVRLGRGLHVSAPGVRPVSCQAFAYSAGAQSSGYEGHQLVLGQIQDERVRIRDQYPHADDAASAPYHWRFQVPDLWFVPVALAAFEAVYALGVLLASG